jgi:hypothetical protein
MKKFNLFCASIALLGGIAFTSCDKADNAALVDPGTGSISALETYYFTVEGASFINAPFPAATTNETIQGLHFNPYAIKGGTGMISINTTEKYTKFFVGAEEAQNEGYFQFIPSTTPGQGGEGITPQQLYNIAVLYSTLLDKEITVLVSAEKEDGKITEPLKFKLTFVESFSGTGDIDITLSFDQLKDVDLHVYTPSGRHIYYGDKGFDIYNENNDVIGRYGLDIDSNAGCNIDGINNENVVIPADYVENGEYIVTVDMWSNCAPIENPTNCIVTARYKGNFVTNIIEDEAFAGKNPVYLTYAYDCGNGDHTQVMKFVITDAPQQPAAAPARRLKKILPTVLDEMKMEEDSWK